MSVKPFVWPSRVRFGDTDASGRIFYISLLNHFDAAETEFLRSLGVAYNTLDSGNLANGNMAFPRVHLECDYTSSLVFDDPMDIAVTVDRVGRTSFTLAFDVSTQGRNAAHGKVVIACIDRRTQRAVPIPEKLRAALCS